MIKKSKKFLALGLSLATLVPFVGNFSAFAAGDGESSHTATESQSTETKPEFETKETLTFDQKTGILTVYSEEGLGYIGDNFSHYENVEKIVLRENVKYIPDGILSKLPKLTTVEGNNVEEIEGYAFNGCSRLTTVVLPNVTNLRSHEFSQCAQLSEVKLPKVTEIGEETFKNCASLIELDIPEVTNIQQGAFKGCINLKIVNFDKDKCTVDVSAFENSSLIFDKQKRLTPRTEEKPKFNKETRKLEINSYMELIYVIKHKESYNMAKEIYFGKGIEFIPSNAFKEWKCLEKISAENINFTGEYAFQGCINLKEVINLSTSVIEIAYGRYAFSGCTNLSAVEGNVDTYIVAIDEFAFKDCRNLKVFPKIWSSAVVNPNAFDDSGFIFIGNRYLVFRSKQEIVKSVRDVTEKESQLTATSAETKPKSEGITFDPKTKTLTIHSQSGMVDVFWRHSNYEEARTVIIEEDVKYIPTGIFRNYLKLEKIEGAGVECVEDDAFINCICLKEVSLPAAEEIQLNAFKNCVSLLNIELPKAKIIGEHAFDGCSDIENVIIPEAILISSCSFFNCEKLKNVEYNSETCCVQPLAFYGSNFVPRT